MGSTANDKKSQAVKDLPKQPQEVLAMKELDGLISDFFIKARDAGTAEGIALCEGTLEGVDLMFPESVAPDLNQFKRDLIDLLQRWTNAGHEIMDIT